MFSSNLLKEWNSMMNSWVPESCFSPLFTINGNDWCNQDNPLNYLHFMVLIS
ncbi:unnamed protein product [Spirodela intermedia]|uniref:Uncharacterized protein n=1 Tax=Spirodela intermedia TaxID=51605 RepID=A0A7I8LNP0_SPIIN|nr:unnamed protein product [Spirodela intermedia]